MECLINFLKVTPLLRGWVGTGFTKVTPLQVDYSIPIFSEWQLFKLFLQENPMETNSFPHNAFGSVHCWPCFSSTWTQLSLAVLDLKHKWKKFKFLLGPISWFPLGLYLFSFYSLPDFFQIVSMMCSHSWVNVWHYVWVCFCLSVYVCLSYIICVTFFGSFGKPGL